MNTTTPGQAEVERRIQRLTLLAEQELPLFPDDGPQPMHPPVDGGEDVCEWRTSDEVYEIVLDELIGGYMAEVRNKNTTVSDGPCETSRDKTQPGCSGGCRWCCDEHQKRAREIFPRPRGARVAAMNTSEPSGNLPEGLIDAVQSSGRQTRKATNMGRRSKRTTQSEFILTKPGLFTDPAKELNAQQRDSEAIEAKDDETVKKRA